MHCSDLVAPAAELYLPLPQLAQDAWLVAVDDAVAYLPGSQSPDLQLAWPSWSLLIGIRLP